MWPENEIMMAAVMSRMMSSVMNIEFSQLKDAASLAVGVSFLLWMKAEDLSPSS